MNLTDMLMFSELDFLYLDTYSDDTYLVSSFCRRSFSSIYHVLLGFSLSSSGTDQEFFFPQTKILLQIFLKEEKSSKQLRLFQSSFSQKETGFRFSFFLATFWTDTVRTRPIDGWLILNGNSRPKTSKTKQNCCISVQNFHFDFTNKRNTNLKAKKKS